MKRLGLLLLFAAGCATGRESSRGTSRTASMGAGGSNEAPIARPSDDRQDYSAPAHTYPGKTHLHIPDEHLAELEWDAAAFENTPVLLADSPMVFAPDAEPQSASASRSRNRRRYGSAGRGQRSRRSKRRTAGRDRGFQTSSLAISITPASGHPFGLPGQAVGKPGQAVGLPGQAVKLPGQAVKQPGQAIKQPGQAVKLPGQAVKQPGQAVKQPGQAVKQPGQAVKQPGQAVKQPGHAVKQPGQAVKKP